MRIRTKKYEIMITPNDKYLLVVLQVSDARTVEGTTKY